jgi:hypothetical protein
MYELHVGANVAAGATITNGSFDPAFFNYTFVGGNFAGSETSNGSDILYVHGNMSGTHVETGSFTSEVEVFGNLSGTVLAPSSAGNQIVRVFGDITASGYVQAANLGLTPSQFGLGFYGLGFYVGGNMAGTVIANNSFGPNTPGSGIYTVVAGDLTGTMTVPDPNPTTTTYEFGGLDGTLTITGPELTSDLTFGEIGVTGNATLNISGTVGDPLDIVTITDLGDFGSFSTTAIITTGSNFVYTYKYPTLGEWVNTSNIKTGIFDLLGGDYGTILPT